MRLVNRQLRQGERVLWGALPILLIALAYILAAAQRHAANPFDKILPLPSGMAQAMSALIFEPACNG